MTTATGTRGARVGLTLCVLLGVYFIGRAAGLETLLSPQRLQALVAETGAWGSLTFAAIFVGGVLAQVPGVVFLSAAPLVFPAAHAWALCLIAGNVAVNLNFAVVRRIGGPQSSTTELERPFARRVLEQLDRHPVRAVGALRVVMIMFPPLTGVLALTPVRARDHALGSALGLLAPISAWIWAEAFLVR